MKFPGKRSIGILIFCLAVVIFSYIYIFYPPKVEIKRIGILLYQETPTTLSFVKGLTTSLANQGYYQGTNLIIHIENTGNSQGAAALILKKLKRRQTDLLITTGKDLTVIAAHSNGTSPIIFALISDPIRDETIKTLIKREKNVTGVSYFTPYDRTIELSKRVIPHLKKLAVLLPEKYSWPDSDKLKAATIAAGIDCSFCPKPFAEIPDTVIQLYNKTDAIYLPNEVQLIMQRDLIQKALKTAQLPAISNNLSFQYCSVLTYFPEPLTIGQIAGQMAVEIFHGANINYMPVELSSYFKLIINLRLLRQLNFIVNEDVLSYANEIIQ